MDNKEYIYYKDEVNANPKSRLGIEYNKIVEIKNFLNEYDRTKVIEYLKLNHDWSNVAFYNSFGMDIFGNKDADDSVKATFSSLIPRFATEIADIYGKSVKSNSIHAQKWEVGGYANPHSDNSDFDGKPNAFEINKYVALLYLNDDYGGGEIFFPEHQITVKPSAGSLVIFPGGIENIHGVKEITSGTRYTIMSFFDFMEQNYSDDKLKEWVNEIELARYQQSNNHVK